MTPPRPEPRPWILLFTAVALVAANMRMTIAGVGPLLDQIAVDQGLPVSALGALGSVPLLAWALFSPVGHWLSSRIGMANAVSGSLVVLALGTVWRSLPGTPLNLWLGTGLIGIGLAIANVLMPAMIKRDFPNRLALVMGVYTSLLSGASAVVAGTVVPISQLSVGGGELGWRFALLCTGALLPVALLVWMWAHRGRHDAEQTTADPPTDPAGAATVASTTRAPVSDRAGRRVWGDRLAWCVSIYQGSQSAVFYVISTWFVAYRIAHDQSAVAAGVELMTFQFAGIAGSMLVTMFMRGRLDRWLPMLLGLGNLLVVLGILFLSGIMPVVMLFGGAVSGASLTMALMVIARRARTGSHATALSGMAQSIGYTIAAVGPIAFGWLHGTTDSWVLAFGVAGVASLLQLGFGVIVGRPHFVLEPRSDRRAGASHAPHASGSSGASDPSGSSDPSGRSE